MDTFRDLIAHRNSNVIHAIRNLSAEDMEFYERFAPVRLEYLIGYKGLRPTQEMIKQGLKPGADVNNGARRAPFGLYSHLISLRVEGIPGSPTTP